jgi:Ca2+-binding RTX toxin-like protein
MLLRFTSPFSEQAFGESESCEMVAAPTSRRKRARTVVMAVGLTTTLLGGSWAVANAGLSYANTVGQGFTVTPADLAFILQQIKIAEHHAAHIADDPLHPCAALVGPGPDQVPDVLTPYGLRTVDGSCNNLIPGRETFGATDQTFPRLTTPTFLPAEDSDIPGIGPVGPPGQTSYAQTSGSVVDSQPRMISNLIADQTSTNPAAVAAAAFPVRTQGNPGLFPCTTDPDPTADPPVVGVPSGCVPSHQTLFIPNVTTDVGLSPPYNSLFTIFGQFFDHGLDKVNNGGSGTVFVPLKADDPLVAGADHVVGTADDLPASQRFMVLTRATNQPGPDNVLGTSDDVRNGTNSDSPWVDLSQAYASHASHQVFLREYAFDTAGHPQSTGRLLGSPDGSMANWGVVKQEVASKLGLQLVDTDVSNIPMIAADPYGNFLPGPNGLAQYVLTDGTLLEGNLLTPVAVPANGRRINTAFLNDIAHTAAPTTSRGVPLLPDFNTTAGLSLEPPCVSGVLPDSLLQGPPVAGVAGNLPVNCVASGEYDNELLDLHVIAGDGRSNENIGLTSIHTIFEHEHNRLVTDIQNVLTDDTSASGVAALAEWQNALSADGWNGARLFQAARFITEMQYQHLVFEEFGRKVQPLIDPFHVYHTDINPAITAEFAHAVYRFGHSMLNGDIPRRNVDGSHSDMALLDAFLNPAAFKDVPANDLDHAGGDMGAAGAGAIVMGLSDQVGNELDEFLDDTLRNNLLGLPLDLASLNITRARSEGVPSLNELRRQIHAATNDSAMQPYTDWIDFGLSLKHPESLVNFVAAYGTHPTITAETTLAGKRAAAVMLVDPPMDADPYSIPADAFDFLNGTGAWVNVDDKTVTGLDNVDLWMGGLAERQNLNGGLLGSTFNFVFETQLTELQNGDRFYYLARTPGTNLRTQLEGNSFAELTMRNTTAHTLKADSFATADCKFEFAGNPGIATPTTNGTVTDDPTTTCNERKLLIRMADGTIRYRTTNTVDPAGINGQSVYNGTVDDDRMWAGVDNDTMWGNDGNDRLQSGDGDDVSLGGNGNDILTDTNGADVLKGGPGNDAIDGGPGFDILMGGTGADFMNGGLNDNETFAGEGNDFIIAGAGADGVFGSAGDDWIEGGTGQDLLQGDSAAPFFNDVDQPGNDVMVGQAGENDYDAEGGDDIMASFPAIERNAGAAGWDWVIGQYDTIAMDVDLTLKLIGIPIQVVVNRDRYQEIEAVSGTSFNDKIFGDSTVPVNVGGGGFTGCDALDQDGIDRITGLQALVPALNTPTATVTGNTAANHCPLTGPFVWGAGEILIGGAGSDTFQGNGGDDIIDGDKFLHVRISVRTNPSDPATELGTTDLMENVATSGNFGPGTNGMTLQQAVFAGRVDPGNLVIVREILTASTSAPDVDTAIFTGPLASYTITANANGSITVTDSRAVAARADGIDTVWNVEQLQFAPAVAGGAPVVIQTSTLFPHPAQGAPVLATTAPATMAAPVAGIAVTASTTGITDANGLAGVTFNYQWQANGVNIIGANASSFTPTGAEVGATLQVVVTFVDNGGFSELVTSVPTGAVVAPPAPVLTLAAPTLLTTPGSLVRAIGTPVSPQVINITNTGNGNLLVTGTTVTGANAAAFPTVNGCTTVLPGASCTITVNFTSVAPAGARTATLSIASNVVGSPTVVSLNGSVVVNSAPNGAPVVDDQTPTEGSAVNAMTNLIGDLDGLSGIYTYQWQQSALGGAGAFTNIAGATVSAFVPGQTQVNRRLRVVVTFVDLHGTTQTLTSLQTTSVVGDLFPGIGDSNTGVNVLTGTTGDDAYFGGLSNDNLSTGNGNDLVSGDEGDDTISTGIGDDTIRYSGVNGGFDSVNGGTGVDTITAMADGTLIGLSAIAAIETVTAGGFTGVGIVGTAGNNTLNFGAVTLTGIVSIDGGAGIDTITGSAGNDLIIGGTGNDTLTGGAGADTFRYGAGAGADRINDFVIGTDRIDLRDLGVTSANFGLVVGIANGGGGSTIITVGSVTIRLLATAPASVGVSNFILG